MPGGKNSERENTPPATASEQVRMMEEGRKERRGRKSWTGGSELRDLIFDAGITRAVKAMPLESECAEQLR